MIHHLWHRVQHIATFPWRLARRRVSAQLIYSQVLVVLLTILLIEIIAITFALTLLAPGPVDGELTDWWLAERTRVAGVLLASDAVASKLAKGAEKLSGAEREELGSELRRLVQWPSAPLHPPSDNGTEPPLPHNIAYAMVVDAQGTIAVSTDPVFAPAGQSVEVVDFPLAARLTWEAIALGGEAYNSDDSFIGVNERITVASYPIRYGGRAVGAVTLQGVQWEDERGIRRLISLDELPRIAITNGIVLAAVSIPALLVSIPVGVWRARRISRRLSALAGAADAMAAGDLNRRVEVSGADEISRVSHRFNDMIDRLQEADRARKVFVSNVSHELRTPVAVIQGNVERMLNDLSGSMANGRRELELIYEETATLSRLIDDLFTLARIEEAALPLEALPISIHDIANQAVESIRAVAWEQRKVTMQSILPEDLPFVLADRTRLRQILNNLLYNALRHTPEGGLIVVDASRRDVMVEVSVTDTGVGIPPDELERVFERFHRVEQHHRHGDGSGLGLAIVKQLVEAQHGSIDVESTPGRGTRFHFTLPVA